MLTNLTAEQAETAHGGYQGNGRDPTPLASGTAHFGGEKWWWRYGSDGESKLEAAIRVR